MQTAPNATNDYATIMSHILANSASGNPQLQYIHNSSSSDAAVSSSFTDTNTSSSRLNSKQNTLASALQSQINNSNFMTPNPWASMHEQSSTSQLLDWQKYNMEYQRNNHKKLNRASSFDECLARQVLGNEESKLHPIITNQMRFNEQTTTKVGHSSSGLGSSEYARLHSSLPNLASSSVESESSPGNDQFVKVSDFISKLTESNSRCLEEENKRNINMTSIQNYNDIRDMYTIRDVHKMIRGNLQDNISTVGGGSSNDSLTASAHRMNSYVNDLFTKGQSNRASSPPNIDSKNSSSSLNNDRLEDSSSPSCSGLSIRKKPSRALTGRHVRSGTGASKATLASLREKLKERSSSKSSSPSTPTTSRPTGRGRGRRRC